jgi:RHS repeat-associated protein
MLQTTDERGDAVSFGFNQNAKIQSVTDAAGNARTMSYTGDEVLSKQTDRTGATTNFTYDKNNLLNTVTSPAGESFTLQHDSHHRVSAVLDSGGKGVSFGYNQEDGLTSITDGLQHKTTFTLDALGFPTQITTPLGEAYELTRDPFERLTSMTDPTGTAIKLTFDARGLTTGMNVGGLAASYTYDNAGVISSATNPNGNVWTYGRDSGGRLQAITDPLKRAVKYTYDSRNRYATQQTALGTITFSYDAAGNLARRQYSDSTDLQYAYDKLDRLVTGPGMQLSYDAESRITGSNGLTVGRDGDGRIGSIGYATGKTVTYTYNTAGLLAGIKDWVGGSTAFGYDAAHQLTSITRPNGRVTSLAYDADGRISGITEDAGPAIAIQRDAAGRIVSESRTQLPAASPALGQSSFAFDAGDQMTGNTYDAMGRVQSDSALQYTWDLASRLSAYAGPNVSASATYDGFGQRTSLSRSGATQNFVWNYATDIPTLATTRNGAADLRYYVYLPGGTLLYAIDAATGARHFYHFDASGSTTLLTDDSGAITDTYAVTPYGESVSQNGSTDNPFTWMGQLGVMQEGLTSLFYMRGRYYDSASARFLSPDPVFSGAPQDVNPYQYAHADPLRLSDPLGTQTTAMQSITNTLLDTVNPAVSSGFSTLKSVTPEGGSPLDVLGGISTTTGAISKGLNVAGGVIFQQAEDALEKSIVNTVVNNPGATIFVEDGTQFANFAQANQLASGLKGAGQALDAAGKFVDVLKEGIKLNDAIIAAQKEQATNAAATDVAEAAFLKDLRSLYKAGKIDGKTYIAQARAYVASTYQTQSAGIAAMTIDEWIAGAKFVQNSLISLASSGYSGGKGAVKAGAAALSGAGAKWVGNLATWVGSLWSGTNVNAITPK